MNKLSVKQKQVLEAIQYFINIHNYPPTCREIANILKCDVNTVFKKLMILEAKGYIKTTNGKSRTIVILRGVDE